jgi:LysM repeat protein
MTLRPFIGFGTAVLISFSSLLLCCNTPQEEAVPLIILTQEEGFDDLLPEEEEPGGQATLEAEEAFVEEEAFPDDPQPYTFVAEPGESVGLYAEWSKLTVEQLLSGLKIAASRHLRAGREYTLVMTPGRWDDFLQGRSDRERNRRARFFEKKYIVHYRTHIVSAGETPGSIARKYEVPMWLLVETNNNIEASVLSAGDEIDVPIVADNDSEVASEDLRPTLVPARVAPTRGSTDKSGLAPAARSAQIPTLAPARNRPTAPQEMVRVELEPPKERAAVQLLRIRIKTGETLGDIALMGEMGVEEILQSNKISNPNRLWVGQEIALPLPQDKWPNFLLARERRGMLITAIKSYERRGFRVIKEPILKGETAYEVADRVGAERSSLALLNPTRNFEDLKPGQRLRFAVPGDKSDARAN